MEFSRQEYWSGLPFPSPGYLPNPGIKPGSPASQVDFLPTEPPAQFLFWPFSNKAFSFPQQVLNSGLWWKGTPPGISSPVRSENRDLGYFCSSRNLLLWSVLFFSLFLSGAGLGRWDILLPWGARESLHFLEFLLLQEFFASTRNLATVYAFLHPFQQLD